jgi:hypothetical protein
MRGTLAPLAARCGSGLAVLAAVAAFGVQAPEAQAAVVQAAVVQAPTTHVVAGSLPASFLTSPVALSAQGSPYSIPPTSTGALGLSKNTWGKASDVANGVAAVAAGVAVWSGAVAAGASIPTLGLSVPTAGTVAIVAGLVSAGAWAVGSVFSYLSRDPADRRFRLIFRPVFAKIPAVRVPAQFAAIGAAVQKLLQSELKLNELATAFVTSVNRATGARDAHAAAWVQRQRLAAAKYARQAATLLLGFEGQRGAIERAVLAAGISLTLTPTLVASGAPSGEHGLSSTLTNELKALTKGSVARALKRRILNLAALKKAIARGTSTGTTQFPQDLPDPAAARSEAKVAGALIGYASSVK